MSTLRFSLAAALLSLAVVAGAASYGQSASPWDGTWTGMQGRIDPGPIAISIAHGQVVSYTLRGSPFQIQYSSVTPTSVSFGDRDHYFVKLEKTGDATASGRVHGRLGEGNFQITRQ
jgi:Rieske Fe-S protein